MNIVTAAVLLVFACEMSSAQEYVVIQRKLNDIFMIPRSLCSTKTSLGQCHEMDAYRRYKDDKPVDCSCQCEFVGMHVFGFFDSRWKCENNSKIRSHAECPVLHIDPRTTTNNSPLTVVSGLDDWIGFVYTKPATNCKLQDQFSYLDCHGAWKQSNNVEAGFVFQNYRWYYYWHDLMHKGYKTLGQYNPPLYGRVIKLNIRCTSPRVKDYCVVLKVQGQPKCIITIQTRTTAKLPAPQPTTAKLPLPSPSSCKTADVVCHISESLPTIQPFQITDKKNVRTADNCGMIAGTAVGVATLIGVIIVIIFFKKIKMKRSESPPEREDSSRFYDDIYDEPLDNTFTHAGQLSSNDKQYDYAYADVVLNQDRAIFQISATNDPTYDQCLPVPEDPVNNTLEDTDSMKPVPMRNVLDGPGNEESSYDVVGGIIFKDPVNDVIEELGV